MNNLESDKALEKERYDERASLYSLSVENDFAIDGADSLPYILRSPYKKYEEYIRATIKSGDRVLELAAGTGEFSRLLVRDDISYIASDISFKSLQVLRSRFKGACSLLVHVADMECLPFESGYFDVVTCAGGLSYGSNSLVMNEIYRVLKNKGHFICVDSLNHNPIYRMNRFIHYVLGRRSRSTLFRMPTIDLISRYQRLFGASNVEYYGAICWAAPLLCLFMSDKSASRLIDHFDDLSRVRSNAFKFVMLLKKT